MPLCERYLPRSSFFFDFPNAKSNLKLFEADLLKDGSYDAAISGCIGVFHCAAPWLVQCHFDDHWKPIVDGTKNVLASVAAIHSVGRVVLLSSCSAVYCLCKKFFNVDRKDYTESDWNSLKEEDHAEECRKNTGAEKSYFMSKTAAEKEAFIWAQELNTKDPSRKLSLISINPSFVLGTILSHPTQETLNTSMQLLPGLFFGGDQGGTGIVDADNVAEALVQAMISPHAEGRYICSGGSYRYSHMSAILAKLFPERCFAEEVQDDSIIPTFDSSKIQRELNVKFTPLEETLKKSVESLIAKNCLPSM